LRHDVKLNIQLRSIYFPIEVFAILKTLQSTKAVWFFEIFNWGSTKDFSVQTRNVIDAK
jgi:hypothetical protein